MRIAKDTLRIIGLASLSKNSEDISDERAITLFKSHFGCSLSVVFQLWNLMDRENLIPVKGTAKHLFWTLSYMKTYDTYINYSTKFNVSEKTFRKWINSFIGAIARIDVVSTVLPCLHAF
jgi:hypothetical protein